MWQGMVSLGFSVLYSAIAMVWLTVYLRRKRNR